MDVELGEVWEMYSAGAGEWVRVVVTKIEDGEVTLRYEGVLEFITVDGSDMQNPELFRRSELPKPSGVVLRLRPPPYVCAASIMRSAGAVRMRRHAIFERMHLTDPKRG